MKTFANFLPTVSLVLLIGFGLTTSHSFAQDLKTLKLKMRREPTKAL
jgi:hypothetical protein